MDLKLRHTIHKKAQTATDLRTLERDLRKLLNGYLEGREEIQALNLACGRADETGVLAKILSEKTKQGHIEGLDLRTAEINGAKALWKPALEQEESSITCDFRIGQADQLDQWKELDSPDLVFIRHQNYWFDNKAWVKLYDQAINKLREDGVMVITSYFDKEHEMARQVLENLGAIEVAHRFNPDARIVKDSPKIEKSVDRHISVFVKV